MLLSSLARFRLYAAGVQATPIIDNVKNNRLLTQWLGYTSDQVERWLNRTIQTGTYTEYFEVSFARNSFRPKAFPYSSITTVKADQQGQFDGGESTIDSGDYFIGTDARSVVLNTSFAWTSEKGLQIIYTGGMAATATLSTFVTSEPSADPIAGKYAVGQTSGAVGTVVSYASEVMVLDNYYGIFQAGESILFYDTVDLTGAQTTMSLTLTSITTQSLAEAYPSIVGAVEAQARFYWKHSVDFENAGTAKDGTTMRRRNNFRTGSILSIPFLEEVTNMLQPYRRMEV